MSEILLTGQSVTIDQVWKVAFYKYKVELCPEAKNKIKNSRDYIENRIDKGDIMYGVNTGFGSFSGVSISEADINELQINLIRSHSMGVGGNFRPEFTRAIMFLRANALARGNSGCRVKVVEKIIEFLNKDVSPVIPKQGSVGASGDLAPLAHLALALIGEGEVWSNNKIVSAELELKAKDIKPLVLRAKEGLSLVNGCQVMTAVGLIYCYQARRLAFLVDLAGAMTLEALKGSRTAFDPLIAATRPHVGEAKTARNILRLLGEKSSISESHINCNKVQDAYSLRCMPAVHGAAKDTLNNTIRTLEIEANSSTDNPLVFAEDGKILSCGNFHGEPVAFVLDFLCIAMSAMANISECRIEKLVNPNTSGLPAFLIPEGGLNSGFMIVQVAAASLISENKILSHPASVDSVPTSADKEDHVSMGTIAARKLGKIITNAENVVAMEILCAHQALGFLKPLDPAGAVKAVHKLLAKDIPFAKKDRVFSKDVRKIKDMIEQDIILKEMHSVVGDLEC